MPCKVHYTNVLKDLYYHVRHSLPPDFYIETIPVGEDKYHIKQLKIVIYTVTRGKSYKSVFPVKDNMVNRTRLINWTKRTVKYIKLNVPTLSNAT